MGVVVYGYLDAILVPLSLLLTVGYHAYLWYTFKTKPYRTTINVGIDSHRRTWFSDIKEVSLYKYVDALTFHLHTFYELYYQNYI